MPLTDADGSSAGSRPSPSILITSSRSEWNPAYSPDGKQIAFDSNRGEARSSIWICNADGSNPVLFFSPPRSSAGDPQWSPDGLYIAFDANMEGQSHIYAMSAQGGKPIRLTTDPAQDWRPYWSQDGKWIYFNSNRTGQSQIWKTLADGTGSLTRVTRNGGNLGLESADLKWFFYTKGSALWKMPLGGSEEEATKVVSSVLWCNFAVTPPGVHPRGVYYIPETLAARAFSIHFLDFATGRDRILLPTSTACWAGLSLSPDGRYLLYSQTDRVESDLFLVENFR